MNNPDFINNLEKLPGYEILVLIKNPKLGRQAVVKKQTEKEPLEDEDLLTEAGQQISTPFIKFARPLGVFEIQSNYYYFSVYETADNIKTVVEKTKSLKPLFASARSLAWIHSYLDHPVLDKIKRSPEKELTDRINRTKFTNDPQKDLYIRAVFLDNLPVIFYYLKNAPLVMDQDAHAENFLLRKEKKNEVTIKIDVQNRGRNYFSADVAKLVSQGKFFSLDKEGDKQRMLLAKEYYTRCNETGILAFKSFEEFLIQTYFDIICRGVSYKSFAQDNPAKRQTAIDFWANAIRASEYLASALHDSYHKRGLIDLKKVMLETDYF